MSAPAVCPRCGAADPRLPGMVGTIVCDDTWHLRVVHQAPGANLGWRKWLHIAGALVVGAVIGVAVAELGGWLFGGPMPSWFVFVAMPVVVGGQLAWRWWRERARLRGEHE